MQEHARGRSNASHARRDTAGDSTPGRSTLSQHAGHAAQPHEQPPRARGSVFDAYRPPAHQQPDKAVAEAVAASENAPHEDKHADADHEPDADTDDEGGASASASASSTGDHKSKSKHEGGPAKAQHGSGGGEIHIITRAGLRHLRQGGREGRHAAQVLYNNPNAYIVLKEGQQMPRGWKAKATILFPSYTEFEAAANAGRIPKGIDAVVYDNEHWAQTPHYEKTDAVHYAKLFGELAHRLGMVYIAAPTQKWFAADARFADIIDLQLQGREVHTGSYERAVKHDVKLAHHLNPNIDVVAQITSNRNHLDPDHSGNIGAGIRKAERDIVHNAPELDGFWGYLYQQNRQSIRAGQQILEDLADKKEHGAKI